MSSIDNTIGAGGVTPPVAIKVWDPFVRVFHWSLVTLFLTAYLTGEEGGLVHIAAGYAIAGLIALRIAGDSSVRATRGSATSSGRRGRSSPICGTWRCSGRPGFSAITRPAAR